MQLSKHPANIWMPDSFADMAGDISNSEDNGRGVLAEIAVQKQCELTEAVGILSDMYHEMGHLMITQKWQERRREFLARNKETA